MKNMKVFAVVVALTLVSYALAQQPQEKKKTTKSSSSDSKSCCMQEKSMKKGEKGMDCCAADSTKVKSETPPAGK